MRTLLSFAVACLLPLAATAERSGVLRVEGRHLVAPDGERVILRGVNEMIVWTDPTGERSIPAIAATGANAVRLVWLTERAPDALGAVVGRAIAHGLIAIVELHDATCKPLSDPAFGRILDYWSRPDVVAALAPHRHALMVNIANEAGREPPPEFGARYADAVRRLRRAGHEVPLVVDAPGCGQDLDGLRRAWPAIRAADPLDRVVASAHPYWTADGGWTAERMRTTLEAAVAGGMPLILGEVSPYAWRCAPVDLDTLLATAQRLEIGWLAWSWGPGNRDCDRMDMTTDFRTLTETGRRIVDGRPHGLRATSVRPGYLLRSGRDPVR